LTFKVSIESSGHTFDCSPEQNVLAAGLAAGYMLPYNCRSGLCRTCKSRIVTGEIAYDEKILSHYLPAQERANGFALLKEGESKLAVQFRGRTKRRSSGK